MDLFFSFNVQAFEDDFGNITASNRVKKPFHSKMTEIHKGSDLDEIIDEMLTHMKKQIENPSLTKSRFMFDEVLFLDVNFHWLDLTRSCFYISLPDSIVNKKAVINVKNENDKECLKWALTTLLHYKETSKDPQRKSNIMRYTQPPPQSLRGLAKGQAWPAVPNELSE